MPQIDFSQLPSNIGQSKKFRFSQLPSNIEQQAEEILGRPLTEKGKQKAQGFGEKALGFLDKTGEFMERFIPGTPESRVKALGRGLLAPVKAVESGARKIGTGVQRVAERIGLSPEMEEAVPQAPRQLIQKAEEALKDEEAGIAETLIQEIPGFFVGQKGAQAARQVVSKFGKFLPNILQKIAPAAAEGLGFVAGAEAVKGEMPTKEELATGAAVGAALPAAGAAFKKGKELLGKALPEAMVKSALKLKPNQKIRIAEKLKNAGDLETAETAEEWLIQNKIVGDPKSVGRQLQEKSRAARKEKLESLKNTTGRFKNSKLEAFADETLNAVDGVPGLEEEAAKVKQIVKNIKSEGATLSEIDELKTLFDQNTNLYKVSGDLKETAKAKGLGRLRASTRELVEEEAKKQGVDVKKLNQDISFSRLFGDAVESQDIGAGGNNLIKLSDWIVGGGLVGTGAVGATTQDFGDILKGLGIAATGVALKRVFTPEARIKIANKLANTFKEGEAGKIIKFLQGDRDAIPLKTKDKVKKVFAKEIKPIEPPKDFKTAGTAKVLKELEPLAKEARKYKSADEFVKSRTLYHGTSADSVRKIAKEGFDITKIKNARTKGVGIYFTQDKSIAKFFGKDVVNVILPDNVNLWKPKKIKGQVLYKNQFEKMRLDYVDKFGKDANVEAIITRDLKRKGYDGVALDNETLIFPDKKILEEIKDNLKLGQDIKIDKQYRIKFDNKQTIKQLKEIWEKANK